MTRKIRIVTLGLAAAMAATGLNVLAGDLNPPAGPVGPTMKTLAEVEPRIAINADNTPGDADSLFKITQPGSYYLTSDITGVVGKHGIEIESSGVTIDLMGFDVQGMAGSLDGITVAVPGFTNVAVVNGSIRNWGGTGVRLRDAQFTRMEDLTLSGNSGVNLNAGIGASITRCVSSGGVVGIAADASANVTHSTVRGASSDGFSISSGSTDASSVVQGCVAVLNGGNGFRLPFGVSISNCIAAANSQDGFAAPNGVFQDCAAQFNGSDGFVTGFTGPAAASTLANCEASGNSGDGFQLGASVTLTGCHASVNTGHGVRIIGDRNTILHSSFDANGSGGIASGINIAFGSRNRIEANSVRSNTNTGVLIATAGNIIVRNTCSGSATNWNVAAGNVILVVNAATAGAFSGNAGGAAPGSTDPNANFTY